MRFAVLTVLVVFLAGGTAADARTPASAPTLRDLGIGNDGRPFAGDGRRLTTISPNADGYRDRAVIGFRLERPARVRMTISRAKPGPRLVYAVSRRFGPSRHRFVWAPSDSIAPRTYFASFTVDARGARRTYSASPAVNWRRTGAIVVRVREIDAALGRTSYRRTRAAPSNGRRARSGGAGSRAA